MIVTARKHIPSYWLFIAVLPWAASCFQYFVIGSAFTFSLKKFIDNPAGLTFVMSLPGFLSIVINPMVNFASDRIWTRFGRRKPFLVVAWCGTILTMALMPLMPSFWGLLACYLVFNACLDLSTPIDVLKQEIAPPQDRGRLAAGMSWMTQLSILVFWWVIIGRFDDNLFMAGVPITGEQAVYWSAALSLLCMLLLVSLGIKETNPHSRLVGERFTLRNIVGGIFNRNLWPIYVLIFSTAILGSGLGVMGNLLYTDQWNFSKQEMGNNIAIGGLINLVLIAALGIFADKLDRMRSYVVLVVLGIIANVFFYCYVNFVLYDARPTLVELVLFGEVLSIIGILTSMVYTPLVYDFVTRNEMGTFAAGSSLLNRVTGILTLNGVGLFMWGYATLFLPPGGETTRICLREVHPAAEIEAAVAAVAWRNPADGSSGSGATITARPWYSTGAALDYGRAYEVRFGDPDSVRKREHRDALDGERAELQASASTEQDLAKLTGDARRAAKAEELTRKATALADEVAGLDAELQRRAEAWRGQVESALASRLITDGEQILAAGDVPVEIVGVPLSGKPEVEQVERFLDRIRERCPWIVDLRVAHGSAGYRLEVACLAGADRSGLTEICVTAAGPRLAPLLVPGATPVVLRNAVAQSCDLLVVEDPLDRHPSPVTRLVNTIVGWFGEVPGPGQRLAALGRGLRGPPADPGMPPGVNAGPK